MILIVIIIKHLEVQIEVDTCMAAEQRPGSRPALLLTKRSHIPAAQIHCSNFAAVAPLGVNERKTAVQEGLLR